MGAATKRLFMAALVLSFLPIVFAATSQEPVLVRVTDVNYATDTYTFSCAIPPGTSAQRYWTIRADQPALEASFTTTNATLTYQLTQDVLYHIGCQVENLTSGQPVRGDFHVDLRTGPNTARPDVRAVGVVNNTAVTYQCTPPVNVTNYNLYWTILSINGQVSFPALNNRNVVNITVPYPLLWDIDCGIWDIDRNQWTQWGYPVEYFPDSTPYFPTRDGCIPGASCPWMNTTNGTNQTNTTGNQPPLAPGWYEPSGVYNVSPYDFHIHITPIVDPDNDTHVATDFELWDVAAGQRVWSSINNSVILVHIHNADGVFEGNLVGEDHLLSDHDYRLRARVYTRTPNGTIQMSPWSEWRAFHTRADVDPSSSPFIWTAREGYTVDLIASDISVPVNVVRVPQGLYADVPEPQRPLLYVTQLYGQVGMIRHDGSYAVFADDLLNYETFGSLPGSGETGVDGLYVDPANGAVYISLVEANESALNGFQGKVMKFIPNSTGDGYVSSTTILNHIVVVPSHHVHTITRGPDGKLYLSTGDAFQEFHTRDPAWTNGKILRFNDDGSIPADNPVPGTYFWAGGFRNPFGAAWRPGTEELWVTNNGEDSNDGIYAVEEGDLYGWCATTCNTLNGTIHHWPETVAPTAGIFNTGASGFPTESDSNYYVALSGETYTPGEDPDGKRIVEFHLEPNGSIRSVEPLVTYTGDGYGAPIGLSFGPEGLYFTDIYGEAGFVGVGETRGNIYLIRPGEQVETNGTNTSSFTAGLGPAPWFPQGLNMIWKCVAQGGEAPFTYKFRFGDGVEGPDHYTQDNIWHTYPANGTYNASCTITDTDGDTASAHTTLVLGTVILPPPGGNQTNGTNTTGNTTNGTICFSSLATAPSEAVTCNGGTITQDNIGGGSRDIRCVQGGNSIHAVAWDKSDGTFELYRQEISGVPPEICIAGTCVKHNGFAKSPPYPICVNGTTPPPPTPAVCGNGVVEPGEECDGSEPDGSVCLPDCSLRSCDIIDALREGETRTYSIDGLDYETTLVFVTDPEEGGEETMFSVNGELTPLLEQWEEGTLPNGATILVTDVLVNSREGVASFCMDGGAAPTASLAHAEWFPQGLNTVLVCTAQGFTPTTYKFVFGDGIEGPNHYTQDNIWHTYPAPGSYGASCTASDGTTNAVGILQVVLT